MFLDPKFFRVISIFLLLFTLTVFAFGDTIKLKNGSIVKGRIMSFDNGKFTVLFDDGVRQRQQDFSADEIESIVFDSTPAPARSVVSGNSTDQNTTIITVGQSRPKDIGPVLKEPAKVINTAGTSSNTKGSAVGGPAPIRVDVRVLADETANGWTNSGWVVAKGQRIKIRATGSISLGNSRRTSPAGLITLPDPSKLMKDKPTGSLIAVIGADNNDFIYIGESGEFVATRDGDLFFGVNEGNLADNSGAFDVVIEIDPNLGN